MLLNSKTLKNNWGSILQLNQNMRKQNIGIGPIENFQGIKMSPQISGGWKVDPRYPGARIREMPLLAHMQPTRLDVVPPY